MFLLSIYHNDYLNNFELDSIYEWKAIKFLCIVHNYLGINMHQGMIKSIKKLCSLFMLKVN